VDMPASCNYYFRPALTTFAVQQGILRHGRAPSDLVTPTLRGAGRVAIKAADLTLSRAAVAMSAAGLVEWLTLLAADRAVVVLEHLNRHSDAERAAPPANHYRSRPAE